MSLCIQISAINVFHMKLIITIWKEYEPLKSWVIFETEKNETALILLKKTNRSYNTI